MKRLSGVMLLLVGVGGCVTMTGPSAQSGRKPDEKGPAFALPAGPPPHTTSVPPPNHATWRLPPTPSSRPDETATSSAAPSPDGAPIPGRRFPAGGVTAPLPQPLTATPMTPGDPLALRPINKAGSAATPVKPALPPAANAGLGNQLPPLGQAALPAPKAPPALPPGIPGATTPNEMSGIETALHKTGPGAVEPILPVSGRESPSAQTVKSSSVVLPEGTRMGRGGAPLVRLVNTKRITLNFQVQNVGQSGLSGVELWYTQDCREWKKHDAPVKADAYVVEVDEEGMYGFTLLARSGAGLSKDPPGVGDQPQVWVTVDLSKPVVQLLEVTPTLTHNSERVAIRWTASDTNLARHPISLYYAEQENGPWKVIGTNLENNGQYDWAVPPDAPAKFLVRVEANDLAGNVGRAQSPKPVALDTRKPEVTITNVEANAIR